jgi:hypothetical protein
MLIGFGLGKPEGKRQLRRPRCRWPDNMKMDLREIGWAGMNWLDLARDMDHCKVLVNLRVLQSFGEFLE